jgi:hypothetical protein
LRGIRNFYETNKLKFILFVTPFPTTYVTEQLGNLSRWYHDEFEFDSSPIRMPTGEGCSHVVFPIYCRKGLILK